ncbi:MAG: hypothetical protein ACMUIU_06475 [bacterium]
MDSPAFSFNTPLGYADLPPTPALWLAQMIPVAFANYFYNFPPPGYSYYDWMDPEGIAINPALANFIISSIPAYLSAADIVGYPLAFEFLTISDMLF